ncbi:WxcM-like domain-containing protein [Aequorivita marisscotiae]|uniref:WxcM-like domain-containing protein n=1 Tax=Aequorivita marisscotiae TaxID=3040348 RepID=A0ABY8KRX9_9FLAO|nr:WxcM-like domain-containing protein [Aequorivita sp. Ant34-E75]WGF92209.1 WxcM-like domain-containing protein [Aequorivita sp. Ant34-E75]
MEVPYIIKGGEHTDERGQLCYNNDFNLTDVKRIYRIENWSTRTFRGWQGHKIERRWFSAVSGSFKIELIAIDKWDNPAKGCNLSSFELLSDKLDVLFIPNGYVSRIQALERSSKLLVMADYLIGEVEDEYRFEIDYFNS